MSVAYRRRAPTRRGYGAGRPARVLTDTGAIRSRRNRQLVAAAGVRSGETGSKGAGS